MSGKSLSLPGMTAEGNGARRLRESRGSRFDPPAYFTTVHVPGYNVLTSVTAARRRQERRRKAPALNEAAGLSSTQTHRDARARTGPGSGDAMPDGRKEKADQ